MNESSFQQARERAVSGDSAGFDDLYRAYAGRIRGFAIARGNDDPDAITNDVMLRAFRNLATFEGDQSAFVRWIFTIARNCLIDAHRAARRRPQIVDEDVPETAYPSAESLAFDDMSMEDVQAWLALLTVEQREVIALRLVDDMSLADVAEIVGRPVTAVKALQRRGLRRLQMILLDRGVS